MPGSLRLGQGRVQGVGIVRVEDDRVDALGDQVANVLELAGRVRVAMDGGQRRDLARCERLALAVQTCSSRNPLPTPPPFE